MSLGLFPALWLLAAPAAEPPPRCYDVALLGNLRSTHEGYRVAVTKVYAGQGVPNRIPVYLNTEYGMSPSVPAHQDAVFYLVRLEGGYFGAVSTAMREPLDGRGLLTRARVDALARERKLERCPAP